MRIAALAACLLGTACITTPGLYVEKTGQGDGRIVSDPAGIDCGGDCGMLVDGPITLTASPAANSVFVGWSGVDDCAEDPVCSLRLVDDRTIEAQFDKFRPTLAVTPTAHATVRASGIECGVDCDETYGYGTSVTLAVTPEPGWALTGWTGVDCTEPACTLTMTEDTIATPIVAVASSLHVTVIDYTVASGRVMSYPAGIDCSATSPHCDVGFPTGTIVTLTASSSTVQWSGCMTIQTNRNTCVLEVSGALGVEATFR
jgi:hypothetical protein